MKETRLNEANKTIGRPVTLKKNKEFAFVYRKGAGKASKVLVCICAKSRRSGVRVGFVVSKKIGNSVTRNLVRRRMKEAYRSLCAEISGDYGIIFVARSGIENSDYKRILHDMRFLLRKQNLLPKEEQ